MAKNVMLLKKKRSIKAKQLTKLRAKEKQLRADEDKLLEQLEAVEDEIPADLEKQIQEINDAQTETADKIADLLDELDDLDETIQEVGEELGSEDPDESAEENTRNRSKKPARRSAPESRNFRCRSRCFESRSQRDAFYANANVAAFLQRVRGMVGASAGKHRSVTGADLTIPTEILDVLRDNLHQYSKLINKVRFRSVSGSARQQIIGKMPEGIWMEQAGALNELKFGISEIETDAFMVGGFIGISNYLLKDSDIALGEEIMYGLGQAIGHAVDKGIIFGLGRDETMPVGIVTRLAQLEKPGYWGKNQGEWEDLHSSHVLQLDLATENGTAFFRPFLQACAKARPTFTGDSKLWIMNNATHMDIMIRALEFNSNAALVSGMENTMPVVGGEIIELEFLPDFMVVGGFGSEYLLVEREGGTFGSSDVPLYMLNKTVFKGIARYDGQPISGIAFVAFTYNNSAVTTNMDFAPDYANTPVNSLIVTSAAGTDSGDTKLTVIGPVSAQNKLMALVGAPASIAAGDTPGKGWAEIKSGATNVKAPTGSGVTVVELDADGKVISIGFIAATTAKA